MVVQFMRRARGVEQGTLSEVTRVEDGKVFIQVGGRETELPINWLRAYKRSVIADTGK
jgi:hypothetical protein